MTGKEIYDLIKGFDARTKKNFSLYCKSAYSSSGWLYLYQQICKAGSFDERKIRGNKLLSNKDYWAAKMQLLRQLITSLYLSKQNGNLLEDDRLKIAKDYRMFDFLTSQLKKEFTESKESGRLWRIMELEEIRESLRRELGTVLNEVFSDEEALSAMLEVEELAICKQAALKFRIFMKTGTNDVAGRNTLAKEIEDSLASQIVDSPIVIAHRLRGMVGVAILRREDKEVANRQEKLVQFLLSAKFTSSSENLIKEVSALIKALISASRVDHARKYLGLLQNIRPETLYVKSLKKRISAEVGIALAWEELDLDLFNISFELVNEEHGDFAHYHTIGAKIAFYTGDIAYSIKLVRSLINMPLGIWAKYSWYLLPLEAIIRFEQGEFDQADLLIGKIRRRSGIQCEYVELILKTLISLMSNNVGNHSSILVDSYQKFTIFADSEAGKTKIPRFDFGIWLSSKVNLLARNEVQKLQ